MTDGGRPLRLIGDDKGSLPAVTLPPAVVLPLRGWVEAVRCRVQRAVWDHWPAQVEARVAQESPRGPFLLIEEAGGRGEARGRRGSGYRLLCVLPPALAGAFPPGARVVLALHATVEVQGTGTLTLRPHIVGGSVLEAPGPALPAGEADRSEEAPVRRAAPRRSWWRVFGEPARVRVVLVGTPTGLRDALAQLGPETGDLQVETREAPVTDPERLAEAVRRAVASGPQALALVRGGGEDLALLDAPPVLRAVAEATDRVYVISACGHAADHGLLDELADMVCETPTALGVFLRQVAQLRRALREAPRLAALEQEVEALRRRLEAADDGRRQLLTTLRQTQERLGALERRFRWALPAALGAGVLLGLLLGRFG